MRTIQYLIYIIFICVNSLNSTTYYVSPSGNDANSGLSLSDAFLTIQHASDQTLAGDTVFVANGTYAGFDHRNTSGVSGNPIVFMALGNNVVINSNGPIRQDGINIENADFIVVDGFTVVNMTGNGNGIRVVLSDFCVVRNNYCDNNAERGIFTGFTDDILIENNICSNSVDEHGIYVSNSSDRPIIRYNECFGNNNIGIHLNADLSQGGDGIISDPEIYGNIIHDNNLAAGINMDGVLNAEIYNNLIYNNHFAQGIAMFQQDGAVMSSGAKIYNNTIVVPSDGRWGILLIAGADAGTEIYNNIILNFHAWRGCISAETVSQLVSDYNLLHDKMSASGDGSSIPLADWQALGLDLNSILAGDLTDIFTDAGNDDYHLFGGSQAVNQGTSAVSSLVTVDLDMIPRPVGAQYDIGAYEYAGAVAIDVDINFRGEKRTDGNFLYWNALESSPIRSFTIQRSKDLLVWNSIGQVKTQAIAGAYRYTDNTAPPINLYYRLKINFQTDLSLYSEIVFLEYNEILDFYLYPNPVKNLLYLSDPAEWQNLNLYDMTGNLIFELKNPIKSEINLESLVPATYLIRYEKDHQWYSQIIVKQ